MHTDLQLLSRYHQRGDAVAFRDLMQAHAGMVFATAQRITRDAVMAEDVAQETFLQLARQSQQVTESVGAWLHRVAWRRACNAVRADATRRRHEDAAVADASVNETANASSEGEATWSEVSAALDEVIEDLPDNQRAPLVMHFLQGRSQREIAKELKISQSTVSRAIEGGLAELRSKLKGKGLLCGAGLGLMLATQAAGASAAVPASLITTLGKLSMSGIGGGPGIIGLSLAAKLMLGITFITVVAAAASIDWNSPAGSDSTAAMSALDPPAIPQVTPLPQPGTVAVRGPSGSGSTPPNGVPKIASAAIPGALPVHELAHSFPMPPENPSGHLVRDAGGWIWGTTGTGGNYGLGTIYKMRADGSEWQEMVSFNGISGVPRGSAPRGGLTKDKNGDFWGTTAGGGIKDGGTLFRYNPDAGVLTTLVEFERVGSPWGRPTITSDGQVWGTTYYSIYRYDPARGKAVTVLRFAGKPREPNHRWIQGDFVPDGRGFLWAVASAGSEEANRGRLWDTSPQDSRRGHGAIFKINMATGAAVPVVDFTGRGGAFIGSAPRCGLTMDAQGYLWGTTYRGGAKDFGTVFKIHAETGAFSHLADFKIQDGDNPGASPETKLIDDGEGNFWGTTSYGGAQGHGTVFKVNATTGKLTSVVTFTGISGEAPGGPARGELFNDGAGGFLGACDFGGAGFVGTLYRVEIKTGKFTLLKDISELAKSTEGSQPHGRLVAGADGWLWGITQQAGAHHCGTIYKFNPVTNVLVSVIDFTGNKGPHKGRFVREGLVSDGRGWLWGSTVGGGMADRGTVYKVHEGSGAFVTVTDFLPNQNPSGSPASELVPDGKGHIWGTSSNAIFKVNIGTHALTTIATFTGDRGPNLGSQRLGTLAQDDRGFMWGCALADRMHKCGTLFKVNIATNALTTIAQFTDANQGWEGWQPQGHMHWDGQGFMWFTGVTEKGGRNGKCALVKVDTRADRIVGMYRQNGLRPGGTFDAFGTPTSDGTGLLWGSFLQPKFGGIYAFDTRTEKFTPFMAFSGQGAQGKSGYQPQVTRMIKHTDGNFYGVTRHGGPGNGGTVFRLRFGPTPMTQQATLLADGRVALHGTLTPNGLESAAAFEWGTEPTLASAAVLEAGRVPAGDAPRPVTGILSHLKPETTYYFRLRGSNAANAIPQRGAVLSFVTPAAKSATPEPVLAAVDGGRTTELSRTLTNSLLGGKHALKVNRIPGAGAGFVRGALKGDAYEVGRSYTLTAQADNGYVFHHWSGPGISGSMAENPHLSFVFTAALAKSPLITATFVSNPFRGDAIGSFHGLVYAAEGLTPSLSNTGAVQITITSGGSFTGTLRYDGDAIPLMGAFDTGGLARFGRLGVSPWTLVRQNKAAVQIALQMDLSTTTRAKEIVGLISEVKGTAAVDRSIITAAHDYYDGRLRTVPARYLVEGGQYELAISSTGTASSKDGGATSGVMHLTSAGNLTLVAKLMDGTQVVAQAPLTQTHQAAIFTQLYARRAGSLGGLLSLEVLLQQQQQQQQQESPEQLFWWCRLDQAWLELAIRGSSEGAAQ